MTDVLTSGNERGPWRPSRRQWRALAAALAVVALVAPLVLVVQHRQEQDRLDREALAAVDVVTTPDADTPPSEDVVAFGLRNAGRQPVRLLSVTVEAPGYQEVRVDRLLAPFDVHEVPLTVTPPCDLRLITAPPASVRLDLRTTRGQSVTRRLPLEPHTASALTFAAQYRCGYLSPLDAFTSQVLSSSVEGREVVINYAFTNLGVLPLTVRSLNPGTGLSLVTGTRLPLTLPPQRGPRQSELGPHVSVRLRVTSCSAVHVRESTGQLTVDVHLTGPAGEEVVSVALTESNDGLLPGQIDAEGTLTACVVGPPDRS